jgi:hypothetical protein
VEKYRHDRDMDVARDAVTELANTVSSDAFALAHVLESDVFVDAPAVLGALATTALHLSMSVAEIASAMDEAGVVAAGSGVGLRQIQAVLADCSAALIDMVDPLTAATNTAIR